MLLHPVQKIIPVDVLLVVLWQSDILTLLRWRLVAQLFRREGDRVLRSHMRMLAGEFVPDPDWFLATLSTFNAVVGADTALAFFLDDPILLTKDIEVCASEEQAAALIAYLRNHYRKNKIPFFKVRPCDVQDEFLQTGMDRLVEMYAILSKGFRLRYIRFVTSRTPSALLPVVSQINTAFICFFSFDLLSCAYPALTLRRRGMTRGKDWGFRHRPWEIKRNLRLVARGQFVLDQDACCLIEPPMEPAPSPAYAGSLEVWCLGHLYLCGCRLRHFGDKGCLSAVLGERPVGEVIQRYLVHPGHEEWDSSRVLGWRFPDRPPTCLGVHDHANDEEGHFDEGGFLIDVTQMRFNFQPFFVGDHMLGTRPRLDTDWTGLPYNDILRARINYRWTLGDRPLTLDLERVIRDFVDLHT
ncbi:hypothetical protein C8Q76DRAFT_789098 [Earliella scabrosa]|nr:hypothetical protein C8Q76DRAFT_789098 [Earliella scabrosa]